MTDSFLECEAATDKTPDRVVVLLHVPVERCQQLEETGNE